MVWRTQLCATWPFLLTHVYNLAIIMSRFNLRLDFEIVGETVEYHATMESCSDKFPVDTPNVM
jgi:hypothetical protein